MKIGNIVSTTKINVSEDFNVVQSLDEIIQGLPTLIVGWDYVKKNYPDYDIIERKLSDNLFWTFKKNEKRDLHEEDIYNFVQNTYTNITRKIIYHFVDPFTLTRNSIRKIFKKVRLSHSISYYHDDMCYIYVDNVILGLDLSLMEFIGLNREKLLETIAEKSTIFLSKDNIFIEYKQRVENLDNQVKFVPVLYSIEHE